MKGPSITWVRQQVKQAGKRKLIEANVGSVEGHPYRFVLYNNGGKNIPTMWALHDTAAGGAIHFIYGQGWEGARSAAEATIHRVLHPKPVTPKVKKPRVRRETV